jgi:hypothetical protein
LVGYQEDRLREFLELLRAAQAEPAQSNNGGLFSNHGIEESHRAGAQHKLDARLTPGNQLAESAPESLSSAVGAWLSGLQIQVQKRHSLIEVRFEVRSCKKGRGTAISCGTSPPATLEIVNAGSLRTSHLGR